MTKLPLSGYDNLLGVTNYSKHNPDKPIMGKPRVGYMTIVLFTLTSGTPRKSTNSVNKLPRARTASDRTVQM